MNLKRVLGKGDLGLLPWGGPANVAAAAALFVLITALVVIADDPRTGLAFLYVVPITLLAMQHGTRGAVFGIGLTFILAAIWALFGPGTAGPVGILARLTVFTAPTVLVALFSAEQRRSRAVLAESVALLQGISDVLPDALYVKDTEGRYVMINEAGAGMLGRSVEDVIGHSDQDLFPPATADVLALSDAATAASREPVEVIDTLEMEAGPRTFRSIRGPLFESDGRYRGLFGLSRDVTDESRRDTYMGIQHRIAEGLVLAPPLEELPAMVLERLIQADDVEWAAYWLKLPDSEQFICMGVAGDAPPFATGDRRELGGMPQDFHVRWSPNSRPHAGPHAGPTAVIPVPPDGVAMVSYRLEVPDPETIERIFKPTIMMVSGYIERRRHEAEAERVQNDFFGLISHELRTPLTSIIGYSDLLGELEGDKLSEQALHFVSVISRNAHRELRLVQDLLLLVRVEAGTFTLEPDVMDLTGVVEQSCETVRPQAEQAGVRLALDLESTGKIWADPHRLGQAIDNLLTNAIKFSSPNDEVGVRLVVEGETASIEVEDHGIGVPADEVDKLFDRLFRASGAIDSQIQGTGLGLTIVKSVVEAHRGTVSVRSREGVGTCFRIELPLTPPQERPVAPAAEVRGVA